MKYWFYIAKRDIHKGFKEFVDGFFTAIGMIILVAIFIVATPLILLDKFLSGD